MKSTGKKGGFWGFAQAHPFLTFFAAMGAVSGVVTLVRGRPEIKLPPDGN